MISGDESMSSTFYNRESDFAALLYGELNYMWFVNITEKNNKSNSGCRASLLTNENQKMLVDADFLQRWVVEC